MAFTRIAKVRERETFESEELLIHSSFVSQVVLKLTLAVVCLYFFICSLDFLATSFRLLAGRNTGKVFSQSSLLQNPIVGVMLGILATVLVQSSSTTTSIIVGMVASGILEVP